MTLNSFNIRGLQHGKSLEATSFPSQSVNIQNRREREREPHAKYKWRKHFTQLILVLFLGFYSTQILAQTGNSCNNPYVVNLVNGAGNGEFQFHYPDTMMYVKILNVEDKQKIDLYIDTMELFSIKHI